MAGQPEGGDFIQCPLVLTLSRGCCGLLHTNINLVQSQDQLSAPVWVYITFLLYGAGT